MAIDTTRRQKPSWDLKTKADRIWTIKQKNGTDKRTSCAWVTTDEPNYSEHRHLLRKPFVSIIATWRSAPNVFPRPGMAAGDFPSSSEVVMGQVKKQKTLGLFVLASIEEV